MHFPFFPFFLDQAALFSQKEISIILQQDFHWLRLQIFSEIPTEVELLPLLSLCFSFIIIGLEMQ